MGFFSWLTADTGESIVNRYAAEDFGMTLRTAYLLQPRGEPPIEEAEYEGYGTFGGIHAYDWLALANLPVLAPHLMPPPKPGMRPLVPVMAPNGIMTRHVTEDELNTIGVTIDCGSWLEDPVTGRRMTIFHEGPNLIDPSIEHMAVTWDAPLPGYGGMSANALVAEGRLERRSFEAAVPLKFSFDPNAVYEDLPASGNCPAQGFFYGGDDDEEEDGIDEAEDQDDLD